MRAARVTALGAIGWLGFWILPGAVLARGANAGAEVSSSAPPPFHDFYLSLYGDSGVEVFSDARVFALFAAFNALGYDDAPLARRDPIARPAFHPLRATVRAQAPMSVALQKRFQDFFDAHPAQRDAYLSEVLALGPAPIFARDPSAPSTGLAGLDKLLAAHEAEAHVAQLYGSLAPQLREGLKQALAALDPACREADKWLPTSGKAASVALEVLDAPEAVSLASGPTGVAGAPDPGKAPDVSAALAAYAAARAAPFSGAHVPPGLGELLARVKRRGLSAGSLAPGDYLAQAYGAAVAAQILPQHRQSILGAAADRGLWLSDDFNRILNELRGKPSVEEAMGPRLAALDLKKVSSPTANPGP